MYFSCAFVKCVWILICGRVSVYCLVCLHSTELFHEQYTGSMKQIIVVTCKRKYIYSQTCPAVKQEIALRGFVWFVSWWYSSETSYLTVFESHINCNPVDGLHVTISSTSHQSYICKLKFLHSTDRYHYRCPCIFLDNICSHVIIGILGIDNGDICDIIIGWR